MAGSVDAQTRLRKKYNIFGKLRPMTPQYMQWTILTLFYVAVWKIPLVLNEFVMLVLGMAIIMKTQFSW